MRASFPAALCVISLSLLCSCAGRETQDRLDDLEGRALAVIDAQQGIESRLSALEQTVAGLRQRLDAPARDAGGRFSPRIGKTERAPAEPQVTAQVPKEAIVPPPPDPPSVTGYVEVQPEGLPAMLREDSPAAPASFESAPPAPAPARQRTSSPRQKPAGQAAYDRALALYKQGSFAKAHDEFAAFMRGASKSSLVPNALYWQGECSYSLGRFDAAILSFRDVVGRFPRHAKAAAALLKTGYAYERLGDMGNARFYWQILLDDYPGSAPAKLARERMS